MQSVPTSSPTLSRLPLELFHSIGLVIPLNVLSSTLLSLLLTSRHIYDKTKSLLYFRLVLGNEDAASAVFEIIQRRPAIGNIVREVYVLSERSIAVLARTVDMRSFKFLGGLKDIVSKALLPNLTSIGIYKQSRWTLDDMPMSDVECCSMSGSFWDELSSMAPRLRHVTVRKLADDFRSPWVDCAVVERITIHKRLATFSLSIGELDLEVDGAPIKAQLFKNVEAMRHSIRSLTLGPPEIYNENDNTPIISLNFDDLRSLELHGFSSADVGRTVAFWSRHGALEQITLWKCTGRWFEQHTAVRLLPNLTHLKGSFCDISALLPLLGQLRSLCIFDTYNMQVPYLLSHLLRTSLPNLRSLEVKQNFMTTQADSLEGVHWSPTIHDGGSCVLSTQSKDYISFLVKACPNIEELGFLGRHFYEDKIMDSIGTCFAGFLRLKHMYYPLGYGPSSSQKLIDLTRELADICPCLESIAHLRRGEPPEVAWVIRDSIRTAHDVVIRDRWGMEISNYNDDPFPDTRPYIRSFDY